MKLIAVFFIVVLAGGAAAAQRIAALPPAHALHAIPIVPLALLERPLTIRTGIGTAHDDTSSKSKEAQAFYDQGLAYLHSYVWIEAARAFNQALRLDPALALAYVGLSYALIELNKPADARAALDRARTAAPGLNDHQRRHIEIRARQFEAEAAPRDAARLAAYRQALDEAIAAFPSDVELILQRGVAESPDPADRGQGGVAGSVKYYERALTLVPGHFAAHHYLTHALENTGRIQEALAHAGTYAKAASEVPHARHMHGHDLRRVGRVGEAIAEFEAADRLHQEYFKREQIPAEYDWHVHHNLDLLASSHQYLGQIKKAEALRRQSFALPSNLVVQVYNKREWPAFLRARGRLDEALTAAQQLRGHPHPLIQAIGYIEAGFALAGTGRWVDAAGESNQALKILRTQPEGAGLAVTALLALQGEISLRSAEREKGRRVLLDVAGKLRQAPGPDAWAQALFGLDAMARTARQVGDWELASQLAQQMTAHDPAYGGTHYLLGLIAERNGDQAAARSAFAAAQKAWAQADPDLMELADIRKRLK